MGNYVCVDQAYYKRLEELTEQFETAKKRFDEAVLKSENKEIKPYQLTELEYEMSKAKLAMTSYRLKNIDAQKMSY